MRKPTKKAKKVSITLKEVIKTQTSYICPTCHITYVGYLNKNVIRFKCSCGQVLEVDKFLSK